jgi:acylphosphatase
MPRLRCVVRGKVQGVFFRDSTRRQALKLGLRGWVRNVEDGSVEAVFEGPHEALEHMVEWLHHGPPMARVASVTSQEEPEEGLKGFEVRRT